MTAVGFIIQPGESIPDDVTRTADKDEHIWQRQPTGRWFCVSTHFGTTSIEAGVLSKEWGQLTVTAVREQPAEPERKCPGCGGQPHVGLSCIDAGRARPLVEDGAAEPEPVDVLDLMRQLRDMLQTDAVYTVEADELFPRIEAEVQRLRGDRDAAVDDAAYWKSVVMPPQPDPLVLSLPQVPEGAVGLVFEQPPANPIRFTKVEGALPWRMIDDSGRAHYWALIDLLTHYGPVTVVMREPRTWPQIELIDPTVEVVEVAGARWSRVLDEPDKWTDGTGKRFNQMRLRSLGEVREVFDDKDGTR